MKTISERKYFKANYQRWFINHISIKKDVWLFDIKRNCSVKGIEIQSVELYKNDEIIFIDIKHRKVNKYKRIMWKYKKAIKWEFEYLMLTFDEMKMIKLITKLANKEEIDFAEKSNETSNRIYWNNEYVGEVYCDDEEHDFWKEHYAELRKERDSK